MVRSFSRPTLCGLARLFRNLRPIRQAYLGSQSSLSSINIQKMLVSSVNAEDPLLTLRAMAWRTWVQGIADNRMQLSPLDTRIKNLVVRCVGEGHHKIQADSEPKSAAGVSTVTL
jgi:hypothetical protein